MYSIFMKRRSGRSKGLSGSQSGALPSFLPSFPNEGVRDVTPAPSIPPLPSKERKERLFALQPTNAGRSMSRPTLNRSRFPARKQWRTQRSGLKSCCWLEAPSQRVFCDVGFPREMCGGEKERRSCSTVIHRNITHWLVVHFSLFPYVSIVCGEFPPHLG